ncbi:MAG: hypothetical protein AMJ60_11630 [Desulfobacterales bacterium SG8_35]|nr:MAG: hypothetical protein AMJ60_11630 [Desulfobacterales bacterium SG8_35]
MKKDDLIILFIALLLLGGMLITFFFGGGKSRHGVGLLFDTKPGQHEFTAKKATLDLGQRQVLPAGV